MYILIVNPIAGNGRAKRLYERFIHDDRLNNVTLKSFFTKYDTHAEKIINEQLSKEWVKNLKAIIVFGGDGTFHDVVNGMGNYVIPVALIPGGSGNDFARGINLPKRQNNLINNILNGLKTSYSCGYYTLSSKAQRLFLNCVGFGFDAVVANYVNQSKIKNMLNKLKLGKLSYLYALLVQLFFYEPIKVSIELDGVTKKFHHCFLVTVNNQPYFGGGMKINP